MFVRPQLVDTHISRKLRALRPWQMPPSPLHGAPARVAPPQMLFSTKSNREPATPAPPPRIPATNVVRRDLAAYLALAAFVSAVPAVDWIGLGGANVGNIARLLYFEVVAVGTVYLGVKRQDLGDASLISDKSAALAPVFASVALGGLYFLIKYTDLNPATIYQFTACLFAFLATSELLEPLLGLAAAGELGAPATEEFDEEREAEIMKGGALPALAVSLALVATYLQGPVSASGALSIPVFAALNNCLGWGIAMVSLGVLTLESFTAAAALLLGLFFYDAFFVFKSDVMVTVATKIEAPARFLFKALREAGDGRYPFSVLGLGDVIVPGAFVSLMREFDQDQLGAAAVITKPKARTRGATALPASRADRSTDANVYFDTALRAYALGLATTFVANYVSKAGQPALVYIVPSLLIATLGTAALRDELPLLLGYTSTRAEAAKRELEAWKADRKARKDAKS